MLRVVGSIPTGLANMNYYKSTFYRESDGKLIRARVGGKQDGNRVIWHIDLEDLSGKDSSFFLQEFRACLDARIAGYRDEMRFSWTLPEENRTIIEIPYEIREEHLLIGFSSSGKTADSESVNRGSIP